MALKPPKKRPATSQASLVAPTTYSVQRGRPTDINLLLIPISIVVGVIIWIIDSIIYNSLVDISSRPMLIGILFGSLCIALIIVISLFSNVTGTFEQNIITGNSGGESVLVPLSIGLIIIIAVSMLFQWIYGLNFGDQNIEPTSYVFIIDDSGSMESNDPAQERYNAISTVLQDIPEDFPYMIYSFSDNAYIAKEMSPISEGIPQIVGNSNGGTAIKATLTNVIDDFEADLWEGGATPKVILLTDGYATDITFFSPINKVLKRYASAHISISTIGLGQVDENLMNKIAKTTGGVFIDISSAADLSAAMNSAAQDYTDRDLLSTRYMSTSNALYGILRILFISILGIILGIIVSIAYGFQDAVSLIMCSTVIKSVIGALVMELGTNLAGFSDKFMWLILWILFSLTLATKIVRFHGSQKRTLQRPTVTPNKSARQLSKY